MSLVVCLELDLEPGEEEQEDQPDRREDRERRGVVDQVEHLRPDQDAGDDLRDDRGHLGDRQDVDQ